VAGLFYYYRVCLTRDRQRISPGNAQGEQDLGKAQKRGYRNDRLRARACKGIDHPGLRTQAHRNGKRFVVRADEKLTAFLELESAVRLD